MIDLRLLKWVVEVQEDVETVSRHYFETYEHAKGYYEDRRAFPAWLVIEVVRREEI